MGNFNLSILSYLLDLARDKKTLTNNLQMLEFETISNYDCTKQLKRSPYPKLVPVDAGQLCVKRPKNKGVCKGDSGGPLVIQDDKKKTSNRIHGYYNWIQSKIK
ncbi:unnamed protein product [Pieris macdunnoughi]|uniref:Peptidase S1 domain-containing protein n=1 Tax=Pieris macdunnoughi TaxID=345717 RepID=A0A821R5F6_9NEOP|nr:unnamed protein product [Pieris macdunnoughi]